MCDHKHVPHEMDVLPSCETFIYIAAGTNSEQELLEKNVTEDMAAHKRRLTNKPKEQGGVLWGRQGIHFSLLRKRF